jgi:hypothetical protein
VFDKLVAEPSQCRSLSNIAAYLKVAEFAKQ